MIDIAPPEYFRKPNIDIASHVRHRSDIGTEPYRLFRHKNARTVQNNACRGMAMNLLDRIRLGLERPESPQISPCGNQHVVTSGDDRDGAILMFRSALTTEIQTSATSSNYNSRRQHQ
jgi:hypothetical protein